MEFKKVCHLVRREVLCNLTQFDIQPAAARGVRKMCLNESNSTVQVVNIYLDIFPMKNVLKQGDALSPLLFNFAAVYVFRKVQTNQEGIKLNGMHHNVVYAIDVNILGGSIHTIQKNIEGLVVSNKENGLEIGAEKTKYTFTSQNQHAGQNHNIKIGNKSSERWTSYIFRNIPNKPKFNAWWN